MKKLYEIFFFILLLFLVFYIIYLLFLRPIRIIKYENFECNKVCCPSGWYGNNMNDGCKTCSNSSTPDYTSISKLDENCNCSNNSINSCFACTDPCSPYNPISRQCQKKICQSGKMCRNGKCV